MEETLQLANQFCASVVLRDDRALVEEEAPLTFVESLIEFVEQRYQVASVVPLIIHSFISALAEHHTQHKELLVLSHTLSGDLDGCALRQLLLLAGLVEMLPWNSVQEFPAFAAIIYPSLQEEEIDHLTMNFVSYGGNQISASLVWGYLTWLYISNKDPLLVQCEGHLSEQPCRDSGGMLEVEFAEAVDSLVPVISDQLSRHLFLQSLVQLQDIESSHQTRKTLPIKRLSYIASYLHTMSQIAGLRSHLELLAQNTVSVATHANKPHPSPQHNQVQHKQRLFTMEMARGVAKRMKVIEQCK